MLRQIAARISVLLDKLGARRYAIHVVIFSSFFIISWVIVGTGFGGRGPVQHDDWNMLGDMSLGRLTACTGGVDFAAPWRPVNPVLHCLAYTLAGPNVTILLTLSALIYAVTAFAWYGIARKIFDIPHWFAFAVGLLSLTYPETAGRLNLVQAMGLLGETFTFYGIWLVLIYEDRHQKRWLFVGCLLELLGLLAYEGPIAVWALGLPLILLYRSRRISWRWLWTTFAAELTAIGYLLWRFLILPKSYNETTFLFSGQNINLSMPSLLGQVRDSFLLIVESWRRNMDFVVNWHAANGTAHDLPVIAVSLGLGLAVLMALFIVRHLEQTRQPQADQHPDQQPKQLPKRGRDLLIAGAIMVGLMGLPFDITTLPLLNDPDHTFGTPLAVSVGIIGLLLLFLRKRSLLIVTSTVVVAIVVFNSVFVGYRTADAQAQSSTACDFFVRFTDVVQRLPQNVYVIITAPRDRLVPDYFGDAFGITSNLALLYFEGPYEPASFRYGYFGDTGYMIFPDSFAELTADGVKVSWPPWIMQNLHVRQPLPDLAPLDHTVFVRYDPFRSLTILSAPQGLDGLVIHPEGGATSRASTLARSLCDWDARTRDTIQQMAQASQGQPTATAVCNAEGVTVYKLNGVQRSIAFELSHEELNQFPQKPATNTLIRQVQDIRLFRLTSGELQINALASDPSLGDYVYRWDGCSR